MTALVFEVYGVPQTAGSKRPIAWQKDGQVHARAVHDNPKTKPWMAIVADAARSAMAAQQVTAPLDGPLQLCVDFYRPRPAGHFRTGQHAGQVRDSAPRYPITKPDTSKMLRAVEDALTAVVWRDDCQVVRHFVTKRFDTDRPGPLQAPGCTITLACLDDQDED